jgi:hypothetical protein
MGAVNMPRSFDQRSATDLIDLQSREAGACTNYVSNGILCSYFVKVNALRRYSMDRSLGHSNSLKNCKRTLFDFLIKGTFLY